MTITYPINLPLWPSPRRATWIGMTGVGVTQSPFTGSQQTQLTQFDMWRGSIEYPPMSNAQAREWSAALLSLYGQSGRFLFGDPSRKVQRGTWAGAPMVNGASQTGSSLAVNRFDAGATIKRGDHFQLNDGTLARLFEVTADAVADGSGQATLDIWPRLRTSPGGGDLVTTFAPKGVFRLASGEVARAIDLFVQGITLDIMEAF